MLRCFGYRIEPDTYPADYTEFEKQIIAATKPYTMVPHEGIVSLIRSVQYIVSNKIQGDIVECGVWRGGCMLTSALTLLNVGDKTRSLYLYDTFDYFKGFCQTEGDIDFAGVPMSNVITRAGSGVTAGVSMEGVRRVMMISGYPLDKLHFIKGNVEETIPGTAPEKISLLRLDTDTYASTRHELEHLYPLLSIGGVLIIDDYGHWKGARKATDEYFHMHGIPVYLHRVDYTRRVHVKCRDG